MLLPAELLDHIFTLLRGDISTLKACSKAHPVFSQVAERYIYAHVAFDANNKLDVFELYEQLSKNPRVLDYPRTLEIRAHGPVPSSHLIREVLAIMSTIPRMAKLMSLKLCGSQFEPTLYDREEFRSTLQDCLHQSSIEEVCLSHFYDFPLSVLDNGKNIKKLTLSDCIPIGWVSNLQSLQLQDVMDNADWTAFPELLDACSSSLTRLHLDVVGHYPNRYCCCYDKFSITLSAHRYLKQLSIFARVKPDLSSGDPQIDCALPAIMRLIKTAPALQDVVLRYHWEDSDISFLDLLDWSILQSVFPDICPRIHLFVSGGSGGHSICSQRIRDVLAENEVLMGLVKKDVVILKVEHPPLREWMDFP